jgi:heptosyltransferase-3
VFFVKKITNQQHEVIYPTINLSKFDSSKCNVLLHSLGVDNKKFVVLFPGAGASYRTWQLDKFAEVADYLVSQKGLEVLIAGGPNDTKLAENILAQCTNKDRIVNIAGQLDLGNFTHLLDRSLFYFGSETGPLHIAIGVNTPTIVVLGGGYVGRFYPYGDEKIHRFISDPTATCRGDRWQCGQNLKPGEIVPCIRNISVHQAIAEIDVLLDIIQSDHANQ